MPGLELIAVALPQGHALFTRAAGSQIPCPQLDFEGGWNKYMAAVYQLPSNETIKSKFGADFGAQPGSLARGGQSVWKKLGACAWFVATCCGIRLPGCF